MAKLRGAAAANAAKGAQRVQELLAYAVSKPDGFLRWDAQNHLHWSQSIFDTAVRNLRRYLNFNGDGITLAVEHDGTKAVYHLIGQAVEWQTYATPRFLTWERQFDTVMWMLDSVTFGLRADSPEAMRAELFKRHLGRLQEDLETLRQGPVLF